LQIEEKNMNGKKTRLQSIVEDEEDEEEARPLQRTDRRERRERRQSGLTRYQKLRRFVPHRRERVQEEESEEDSVIAVGELVCLGICIVLLVLKYIF
jgi:hypothetical protein